MVIEYKRFSSWREIYEEEKNFSDMKKLEHTHKIMSKEDIIGKAVERALNRLGDENWILCYMAPHGIYFYRVTTESKKRESWRYPELDEIFSMAQPSPNLDENKGNNDD